jgi:hypothetical protein
MRRAMLLGLAGSLFVGACAAPPVGGNATSAPSTGGNATSAPSAGGSPGGSIVIRTKMVIAATSGSEPTATGEVLEGSTLGDGTFCVGGTIRDSHASLDPAVEPLGLIDRRITCSDGTVRIVFTPGETQNLTQGGSWTIVSGTGAFEQIHGTGKMETVYDPADDSLGRETLTGTVTR